LQQRNAELRWACELGQLTKAEILNVEFRPTVNAVEDKSPLMGSCEAVPIAQAAQLMSLDSDDQAGDDDAKGWVYSTWS
jgi:hypothetical protein